MDSFFRTVSELNVTHSIVGVLLQYSTNWYIAQNLCNLPNDESF